MVDLLKRKSLSPAQKKTRSFLKSRINSHYKSLEDLNKLVANALKKAKMAKQADNNQVELLWKRKAEYFNTLIEFHTSNTSIFKNIKQARFPVQGKKTK